MPRTISRKNRPASLVTNGPRVRLERRRIVVIGSANVDMVVRLPSLPSRGETVTDGEFLQVFGGKGANQAVAAARAGGDVALITCLGRDAPGDAMVKSFRGDGIDVRGIVRTDLAPSGAALVMFDRHGDNYLAVAPGANYQLTPGHVEAAESVIRHAAMLVMQLEIPVDTTRTTLALAEKAGVPVLFNYAPARTCHLPVSSQMTGLVVNEIEASELSGLSVSNRAQALAAARKLKARGPRFVIVTLGRHGACVVGGNEVFHVPAFPVKPVDSTAAGDTYCGALAVALVEGRPLAEASTFAAAAAAISVTRAGAQPSIPTRTHIQRFLREHPSRIR